MRPIGAIFFVSCLLGSTQAHPCSCFRSPGSDSEQISSAFHDADVVFVGEIISSDMKARPKAIQETEVKKTKFRVLKQWKGAKADALEFRINVQCCECGYEFPRKGEFLVYAYGPDSDGHFQTNICTRTRRLSEAAKDVEVLDSLVKGADSSGVVPDRAALGAPSRGKGLPNKALQATCEDARA